LNQLDDLNKYLANEQDDFKKFLLEHHFASQIRATPLKSYAQATSEMEQQIDQGMANLKEDIAKGIECFKQKALPLELKQLEKIFMKFSNFNFHSGQKALQSPVKVEDLEFLEEIARRTLAENQNESAAAMFRFMLQLNLAYSPAWVGWAIAEQEMGNAQVTAAIYQLATGLLPEDYFIMIYAAEFYMLMNEKNKAREMLQRGKEKLISSREDQSASFKEINQLLNLL
jgi:hypothetical protein